MKRRGVGAKTDLERRVFFWPVVGPATAAAASAAACGNIFDGARLLEASPGEEEVFWVFSVFKQHGNHSSIFHAGVTFVLDFGGG